MRRQRHHVQRQLEAGGLNPTPALLGPRPDAQIRAPRRCRRVVPMDDVNEARRPQDAMGLVKESDRVLGVNVRVNTVGGQQAMATVGSASV